MVICLERGADLHMAQLMPMPLTVSCFSKIQIGFIFLVPAHLGSPGEMAVKLVCVYYACIHHTVAFLFFFNVEMEIEVNTDSVHHTDTVSEYLDDDTSTDNAPVVYT